VPNPASVSWSSHSLTTPYGDSYMLMLEMTN